MGRRTSKKSKTLDEVYKPNSVETIMQKVEKYNSSKSFYKRIGGKILKSGTYKSADRFMRKARANAQVGELFTPLVEDYAREFEQAFITNVDDWHVGSDHNPIDDIRALDEIIENSFHPTCHNCFIFNSCITGRCAVCDTALTYKYPEDYPDEWKFCCFCQPNAKKLIDGTLKPTTDKLKKLYDKVTLVKKHVDFS